MYGKYLTQKRDQQRRDRQQRQKEAEALGEDVAVVKPVARTLDNTREEDVTMIQDWNDDELLADEADDEFAPYLNMNMNHHTTAAIPANTNTSTNETNDPMNTKDKPTETTNASSSSSTTTTTRRPKVLITTRPRPSSNLFHFIADLQKLIPSLHYYPRQSFSLKQLVDFATHRDFTHLMVLTEKSKQCNGMILSHLLPHHHGMAGPTAFFKVSSVVTSSDIPHHGASTAHVPELNVHGFSTRLGNRIGRLLTSLFPVSQVELEGRQVVTFHNQRDYIFVRQHRYVFQPKKENVTTTKPAAAAATTTTSLTTEATTTTKAKLQELGPRFTLKLKWLQQGTFDTQFGEYEWYHKRKEMDTTRRRFHL
jgi:ribosome production factor 1